MLNLYAEALSTFSLLFEEAKSSSEIEPDAMMLATASLEGHPSVRTVLLKKFDARGFVFYSHLDSPKGRDLQANPQAALLFLWRSLREAGVQVRIEERCSRSLPRRRMPISLRVRVRVKLVHGLRCSRVPWGRLRSFRHVWRR